jgi:putative phage-type endonuclease
MTAPVPFERWDRRQGIGASEVAALAGLSPWSSSVSVWLEKVGLGDGPRESDAMRAGRDLERTVLAMAARQVDQRLIHNGMTFPHPEYPAVPLYATPDGFAMPRRSALAECKVVAHRYDDWKGGPPAYVDLQVQAQLACLPRVQGAIVAALVGGEVRTWRVDRDPDRIAALETSVRGWWTDHVLGDRSPDPSDDDDRWALLRAFARTSPDRQERVATPDEQKVGTALRGLLTVRGEVDSQVEALRLELADAAADNDVLGVGWRATWSSRSTVDWRALAADLAIPQDAIDAHTTQSRSFTFRRDGQA